MRILFVSHSFPPPGRPLANVGGMQRVATELYAALRALPDVQTEGLLLHTSWRMTHARVPFFQARVLRRLRAEARRPTVDAVLFSSMVTGVTAFRAAPALRRAGLPTAAIVHGLDVTTPFGPYQRFVPRVFAALDAVLPVSRATGEACVARGLDPARLTVVPNGIDTGRLSAPSDRLTERRALARAVGADLPEGALLLASAGRHVRRKGFAWFAANVMPRLSPDVHWWLAGEGPETEAVREAARAHGLEARVRVLGRVSEADLARLYRGADVFAMPNRPVAGDMEGFGVVMLEAGLAGLPTVGAALEGVLDVIVEGENGHLVPSGDPAAFADVIMRYARDRAALAALSSRTSAYVRATFAWEAVARRYVDVLGALTVAA